MLKINKKVEYALMALKHLDHAQDVDVVSTRDLSEAYKVPFDTMAKVMQSLRSAGVVSSIQGKNGGHQLISPLKSLSYMNIVSIIEGPLQAQACQNGQGNLCSLHNSCNIVGPIENLTSRVNSFLNELNLDELLNSSSSNKAASL